MNQTSPPITPAESDEFSLSLSTNAGRDLLKATIDDYVTQVGRLSLSCTTADEQENLIQHVADGNRLIKIIQDERLKITREIDAKKKQWMNAEKLFTSPLEKAMQPLKAAVEAYNKARMELIRQKEQALEVERKQALADQGEANWLIPATPAIHKPKGVRMVWAFEVVDVDQLPKQLLIPNEALIKQHIANGVRDIPGVRIFEQPQTTFRA